jgi:ABC-type transporter Mla subunit MlaD
MMRNKGMFLRVGLLLIGGAVAIFGLVWFLGGGQVHDGARYETYFRESVQGLDVGAPVKFRGVTLGQVNQIGLVSAAYGQDQPQDITNPTSRLVFVRFEIDPKRVGRLPTADNSVRAGLRARLASQGLTGLSYLELDFVDPTKFPAEQVPWKPLESYIPSMPSTITQVQDAAQALLAKFQTVDIDGLSRSTQQVLDDLHTQLTTGDLHQTMADADTLLRSLHDTVQTANLPALTADLKATSGSLRTLADGRQTKDLIAATTKAANQLPTLMVQLEATLRRLNAGTGDLEAGLAPVLRDAQAAAANLRDTTETLRRYPASVLLGAPPPEPRR